jgi:pilus assembly protein CpaF
MLGVLGRDSPVTLKEFLITMANIPRSIQPGDSNSWDDRLSRRDNGGQGPIHRNGMPANSGNTNSQREQAFFDLQDRLQDLFIQELKSSKLDLTDMPEALARRTGEERMQHLIDIEIAKSNLPITRMDRARLIKGCLDEVLGHGPIESLLQDPSISEIMINGPNNIYVEQNGKKVKTTIRFRSDRHLMDLIERVVAKVGRRVDESSPMVDARLSNGSRFNAIIPPVSRNGPTVTIRKFSQRALRPEDFVHNGSITQSVVDFLQTCVEANLNIIVSGGTNSGKTTMLNMLSVFISNGDRIVTIEDSAELQLQQEHVISLEARPASIEGKNRVAIRDLVVNALRMTPDRIIVGECRGAEALDMLQAMNTGHDGSMTTIHANSARHVISRLETLVLHANELPDRAIREQISNALHLIIHLDHLPDGSRRVMSVSELNRGGGERVEIDDIFVFERQKVTSEGKIIGQLRPTGHRPRLLDRLEREGFQLPPTLFQR